MRIPGLFVLGATLALPSVVLLAAEVPAENPRKLASVTESDSDKIARMMREIDQLKNVNQQVMRQIQKLEHELINTVASDKPAAVSVPAPPMEAQARPEQAEKEPQRTAEASRSVTDLEREVHVTFNQTFSLELGFEYAHFDQSQLALNGFLALDAIFLGDISVDEVEADIYRTTLVGRWGVTDRIQLNLDIPYIYRETKVRSRGAQLGSKLVTESTVDSNDLGDISLGLSYHLFPETVSHPDVVLSMSVTAPTGKDPYGIDAITDPDGDNTNLQIPDDLPTGSGVWSLSGGVSLLRTTDPAILFSNLSYTHYFAEDFSDLGVRPGAPDQPGEVKLGDSIQLGLGIAFAINERTSYSMSFTQRFFDHVEIKPKGGRTNELVGSDASVGTFDVGVTYGLTRNLSLVTNLGLGLTNDSSDYKFSLRFPYRF